MLRSTEAARMQSSSVVPQLSRFEGRVEDWGEVVTR